MASEWRPGPVVAWTESDGPGRVPPAPSRRVGFAAAGALAIALIGVLTANTVCPEHGLWIGAVASLTVVLGVTAIVATVKASASSALLSLAAASGGIAIAAIDLAHEVTRNRVVLLAFGAAAAGSAVSAVSAVRLRRWESRVLVDAVAPITRAAVVDAPAVANEAPAPAEDQVPLPS